MLQHLRTVDNRNIYKDFSSDQELLSMIHNGNCILVVGPNLSINNNKESLAGNSSYLATLLKGMVEWCIDKGIINQPNIIEDFRRLVHRKSLIQLGYKIEEYLSDQSLKQQCLKDVLLRNQIQTGRIHQCLTQIPFCGYITTTYDTCIEDAYSAIWQERLAKFYKATIQGAIETHQNKQPFVLKLYGDIAEPHSISLGHQISQALLNDEYQKQLQTLLSGSPVLLMGFKELDTDLETLKGIADRRKFFHYEAPVKTQLDGYHLAILETEQVQQEEEKSKLGTPEQNGNYSSPANSVDEHAQFSKLPRIIEIFLSSVDVDIDEQYKNRLEVYLKVLQRQRLQYHQQKIIIKDSSRIGAGENWKQEIEQCLNKADIILLLISIDFLASDFCTKVEIEQAIKRHHDGKARVIPVILGPCDWQEEKKFCDLKPLPKRGKPVSNWEPIDNAFADISAGVKKAIEDMTAI